MHIARNSSDRCAVVGAAIELRNDEVTVILFYFSRIDPEFD
jgi:hypothetical protein